MNNKVEFIHCTPDAEKLIVRMARVSNPANQDNDATAPRLLRYLIKHSHWSPFEMASLCLKIDTERDIAAQILRHRSFSFQEFSTRYAQTSIAEIPKFRRQDDKNRQNSFDDLPEDDEIRFRSAAGNVIGKAYGVYEAMLAQGVAKETARRILPLCTPTTLYMHSTLRSWIHYIELRSSKETQLEHREIAIECRKIFVEQFPIIGEALNWNKCQDL
jgi:thymidylate synthase (FAD)